MAFRGMTGALRQAVVDAGLEGKIRTTGTIYNDKSTSRSYDRRFNWERCIQKKLTNAEKAELLKCVAANLKEYDLVLTDVDDHYIGAPSKTWGNADIMIYVKAGENTHVEELRKKAAELGYRLVLA